MEEQRNKVRHDRKKLAVADIFFCLASRKNGQESLVGSIGRLVLNQWEHEIHERKRIFFPRGWP